MALKFTEEETLQLRHVRAYIAMLRDWLILYDPEKIGTWHDKRYQHACTDLPKAARILKALTSEDASLRKETQRDCTQAGTFTKMTLLLLADSMERKVPLPGTESAAKGA